MITARKAKRIQGAIQHRRSAMVSRARSMAASVLARDGLSEVMAQACLYHAMAMCAVLREAGYDAIPQAGDAGWQRIPDEDDDGICDTAFGYEWHDDEAEPLWRQGLMPEMHCWVAIPDTKEIIDITTRYWPQACQAIMGKGWPGPKPPDFLWTDDPQQYKCHYRAKINACRCMMTMVNRVVGRCP